MSGRESSLADGGVALQAASCLPPDQTRKKKPAALRDVSDAVPGNLVRRERGERIAGYKLPRSFSFRTEPLPLSGAGKVLKTELRKPFWEGRERQVN